MLGGFPLTFEGTEADAACDINLRKSRAPTNDVLMAFRPQDFA
jgi:hypothetical protein